MACSSGAPGCSSRKDPTAADMERIYECRVCNDLYALEGDKVPRLLACGHTVCHSCLFKLYSGRGAILCPFDRQATETNESGIWGLKKNFALIELLEKLYAKPARKVHLLDSKTVEKQRHLQVPCDENEEHRAVLFCTTCETNLCLECSEATHYGSRTLSRHRRVVLSERPRAAPKCIYHPLHAVEFACLEETCQASPLMCYVCKDYGRHVRHKHSLLDAEAAHVKASATNAVCLINSFFDEVAEAVVRIGTVIGQIDGGGPAAGDPASSSGAVLMLPPQSTAPSGTAGQARERVRQYFADLRQSVQNQELAAMTTLDSHIRERLCLLKQHHDDLVHLVTQIVSAREQCEHVLLQDDSRLVMAKKDLAALIETIHRQQQQFAEGPIQLSLDPSIPITFTKDNRLHVGPKMEMRVVALGLDDAGKTSILFKLKQNEFVQESAPTIGFNVETVEYRNLRLTVWDVGGLPKLRPLWKHYYFNTQALVFVVDSANAARLDEAHGELVKLVQERELRDAALLLLANKQDLTPCLSIEEIADKLGLFKLLCGRSWHIQACEARSGMGLYDGLEWLSRQLVASTGLPATVTSAASVAPGSAVGGGGGSAAGSSGGGGGAGSSQA